MAYVSQLPMRGCSKVGRKLREATLVRYFDLRAINGNARRREKNRLGLVEQWHRRSLKKAHLILAAFAPRILEDEIDGPRIEPERSGHVIEDDVKVACTETVREKENRRLGGNDDPVAVSPQRPNIPARQIGPR